MENLAGNKECDPIVEDELTRARVRIVRADEPRAAEVPTRITGALGPFTFTRAWYYWVVKGPVPVAVARMLLADPEAKLTCRIDGYAGNRDAKSLTGRSVVNEYHIDSQAGLRVFVDYLRLFAM